jgi:hypothetical protein
MRIATALRLGRVSNLPTVWSNVVAGVALSGGDPLGPRTPALLLALSLFYVAGMYLNDAFDAEFDRRFRPERPIPSGEVTKPVVFTLGFALLATGYIVLLPTGSASWLTPTAGAALVAAILLYDAWHKGNPIGPLIMGQCRALVYVTTAASLAEALSRDLLWAAAIAFCYLIGLTYAAKQEDLQKPGHLWPLAFLGVPFVYGLPTAAASVVGFLVYAALLAAVISALSLIVRGDRANIPRVVSTLIASICLLDALFIAGVNQPLLALTAALGFPVTLFFQRAIPGT